MRSGMGWFGLLAGVLMLAACAELPFTTHGATSGLVGTKLGPAIDRFSVSGRLSLRQGERRDPLRFRWEHSPERDSVLLMSPWGQGLAELQRDATGARLLRGTQAPMVAENMRQLTEAVFGTALPLEELANWLRGVYADTAGEVDGWQVNVRDVASYPSNGLSSKRLPSVLPRQIDVQKEGITMNVQVDAWDNPDEIAVDSAGKLAP